MLYLVWNQCLLSKIFTSGEAHLSTGRCGIFWGNPLEMYINSEQKNVRHLRCFGLIRKKKCVIFVVEHKYDSNKNKQFFVIHCHSLSFIAPHQASQRCTRRFHQFTNRGNWRKNRRPTRSWRRLVGGMGPICGDAEIGDEMLPSYMGGYTVIQG